MTVLTRVEGSGFALDLRIPPSEGIGRMLARRRGGRIGGGIGIDGGSAKGLKACRSGIATSVRRKIYSNMSISSERKHPARAGSRSEEVVILNSSKSRYNIAFSRFPVPLPRRPAMRPRMTSHGNFGWEQTRGDVQAPENRRFGWEDRRRGHQSARIRLAYAAGISLSVSGKFHPEGFALRLTRVRAHGGFVATTSRLSTLGWRTPAVIVLCGCLILF